MLPMSAQCALDALGQRCWDFNFHRQPPEQWLRWRASQMVPLQKLHEGAAVEIPAADPLAVTQPISQTIQRLTQAFEGSEVLRPTLDGFKKRSLMQRIQYLK